MKNLLVSVLVLMAGASFGTSMKKTDTRLQVATTSVVDFHNDLFGTKRATVVTVDSYGDVVGAHCIRRINSVLGAGRPIFTDCTFVKHVETLSKSEQRKMEKLISLARLGEMQFPDPNGIHCLAMPTHSSRFTADNGNILLEAGSYPCGGHTFNTSEAAKTLVQTLREYAAKYEDILGAEFNQG